MSPQPPAHQVQPQIQQIEPPSPEVIAQIVSNQTKELELKQKEITAMEHSDERQFDFANRQIEAQERDRQEERLYKTKRYNYGLYTLAFIVVVVCLFFGFCISKGQSEMVVKLFEVICYGGPFGAGGFAWGRYASRNDSEKK